MQKQITVKTTWYVVENTHGETTYLPAADFSANPTLADFNDYVEGKPASCEVITGYGARLSAPG